MIQPVQEVLDGRGISVAATAGCPAAEVAVESLVDGLRLDIEDVDGRKVRRIAASVESAASMIESWVRGDLAYLALAPSGQIQLESDIEPEKETAPGSELEKAVEALETPDADLEAAEAKALIDLGIEVGGGFDGSVWFGGALKGCAVLGPTCLGAAAKIGADPSLNGDSEILETHRMVIDLLAVLDFPFFFEGFTLRPGLEAGVAFVRSTKVDHDNGEDNFVDADVWELEVGGHLMGAIELGRRFGLLVGVSVGVLPLAQKAPFQDDDALLASSPRGLVRGIVGLEYSL